MLAVADTGSAVEADHRELTDGGGIDTTVVDLGIHLLHLLDVTDAAPDNSAAGVGLVLHSGGQVAAQEGALVDLVIHIDNDNVTIGQGLDNPLVGSTGAAFAGCLVHGSLVVVRTQRTVSSGHSAADQLAVQVAILLELGVQALHSNELILVALNENGLPQLFQRHLTQLVQVAVRHLGTAVRETLALPFRG